LIDVRGATDSRVTIVLIDRPTSPARSKAARGPRSIERIDRTNSAGSVARSSRLSSSSCDGAGAGSGSHSSTTGGA
jgi:hypothetical protein